MTDIRKPLYIPTDASPAQTLKLVTMFRDIESPEHRDRVIEMVEAYIAALKETYSS